MSKKSTTPKRRAQVDRVLRDISKPNLKTTATTSKTQGKPALNLDPSLMQQYDIIKKDLLKLRDDLARGYDMAKNMVEKKGFVKDLLTSK